MKFKDLKKPARIRLAKKASYWTTKRCKLLAQNYNILSEAELRKMFGGYSISSIRKQVRKLKDNGWEFKK